MVPSATDVLPVERSPIINSRCPRPIGIMASIALIPVWSGCETDLRGMMPGAFFSRSMCLSAEIAEPPSIGRPRESMVRPIISSETPTDRMRWVRRTVAPALRCSAEPNTTTPVRSFSKLRAKPSWFSPRSTISPACTSSRPATWTTPSP